MVNPGPKDDMEVILEEFELNITTALYLCTIITKLLKAENAKVAKADKNLSYKLIFTLNQMNLKLRDGQTLLHLAVNGVTPVDDFHTSDVCRFPCVDTVKLLLECGAPISVLDCSRNSPLHTLTATVRILFIMDWRGWCITLGGCRRFGLFWISRCNTMIFCPESFKFQIENLYSSSFLLDSKQAFTRP